MNNNQYTILTEIINIVIIIIYYCLVCFPFIFSANYLHPHDFV